MSYKIAVCDDVAVDRQYVADLVEHWAEKSNPVSESQLGVCLRGVLKALVAVELQLSGDLLLFPTYRQVNRIQDDVDRLTGSRLVCHDAVVVQIADPRLIFPPGACIRFGMQNKSCIRVNGSNRLIFEF